MRSSTFYEFRQMLWNITSVTILLMTAAMTYIDGTEFASRGSTTAEIAYLGITLPSQEWAHRISQSALGFPLLVVPFLLQQNRAKTSLKPRCNVDFRLVLFVKEL